MQRSPEVTLLSAMTRDGLIGSTDGGIPWHLPAESAHFRSYCQGKIVLVGRRTYEEMDGWFAKTEAKPIVLSRSASDRSAIFVNSMEAALDSLASDFPRHKELVVIGGGEVYQHALARATRLVLTEINTDFEGGIRFPEIDWQDWQLQSEVPHSADRDNAYSFVIRTWIRRENS